MSPLVSILYICDFCKAIRQFDVSMDKLESEGGLYKVKDAHENHEVILYLNSQYELERVTTDPPAPAVEEPIIKSLAVIEAEKGLKEPERFTWANRIFIPTKEIHRIPVHEFHKLVVLNMDGKNTLADILKKLRVDQPDLAPEYLVRIVHSLKIRGWVREKGSME
ncbi:MAG: hypothetical protein ACE5R6_14550 [Candidatus Heimdallarchaeota archaeon]